MTANTRTDRSGRFMGIALVVVVAVGIAFSYGTFLLFRVVNQSAEQRHYDQHARQLATALGNRLQTTLLILDHLRLELGEDHRPDAAAFADLVARQGHLLPRLQALAWVPRVAPSRQPAAAFGALGPGQEVAPDRDFYPVQLVEPLHGNEWLSGSELGALPDWAAAIAKARDTGSTTVLMPEARSSEGRRLVFLGPVYRGNVSPETVGGRRELFDGVLVVVVDPEVLVRSVLSYGAAGLFGVAVTMEAPGGEVEIHRQPGEAWGAPSAQHPVAGIQPPWRVEVAALPSTQATHQRSLEEGVLLMGGLATVFLAAVMAAAYARARRVEDLVETVSGSNDVLRREVLARTAAEKMQNRLNIRLIKEMQVREEAENQLRRSEDLFRRALAPTGVVVFATDQALRLTWAYNWPLPGDPVGKTCAELFAPADAALLTAMKRQVLETAAGLRRTVQLEAGGGTDYDVTLEPLFDAGGAAVGVTGTAVDVTALNRARAEAESANAAKSRFLAAASHDLRQPVVAMRLFLELLGEMLTTAEQRTVAQRAMRSLGATENLMNALMDVSALEAGKIRPQFQAVPLTSLVDRIADECQAEALERGIALRTRHSRRPCCSGVVRTDAVLLERMLRNLVSNALRYTPGGQVLLATRCRDGECLIEVWDTGVGIPEDKIERIFDDFYQIPHESLGGGIGLGLGLSTVARMARLLGHRVEVKSRQGRGSIFRVLVPIGDDSEAGDGDPAAPGLVATP